MFRIFDRYLIKNFLVPFFYSLFGMVAVWLVYDLGEHANDFQEAHLSFESISRFYLTQIPFVVVTWMPLCVLLGLLYVLTRMSRRNEIVSMLGAGVSVPRVLLPLMLVGLLLTGACTLLNYELGPKGLWASAYMLDEIVKGKVKNARLDAHVFPNRSDNRIWFIQLLDAKNEQLRNVQVIQQDAGGVIQSKIYGLEATYDGARKLWTFYNGKIAHMDPAGNVTGEEFFAQKEMGSWSETPWRLASSSMKGKYMTSVAYSRRGTLGGVAGGLFLFVGLFSSSNVFLALGQGSRISPVVAAWTPAISFLLLGLVLLYLRSTNRPIPFTG